MDCAEEEVVKSIPKNFVIVLYLQDSCNGRKAGQYEVIPKIWFLKFGRRMPIDGYGKMCGSLVMFIYPDPKIYQAHTIINLKGRSDALPAKYTQLRCQGAAVAFASMNKWRFIFLFALYKIIFFRHLPKCA
jgi:hypothetical protein